MLKNTVRLNKYTKLLVGALILVQLIGACAAPPELLPDDTSTIPATELPAEATLDERAQLIDDEPTQAAPTELTVPTVLTPTEPAALATSEIDPYGLVSQESLFAYLEELTAIQAYSGWRNSASQGEAEALDYVAVQFKKFGYFQELGLEQERQSFPVYNATEIWETRLHLTVAGDEIEVPADGIRGQRDDNSLAVRFDSDGVLNDTARDPVVVNGPVVLINSYNQIVDLSAEQAAGKIIILDYDIVHQNVLGDMGQAIAQAEAIMALKPAGIVLLTRFSDASGQSHGSFVGDSNVFTRLAIGPDAPVMPILYARLEDLAPLGVTEWADLDRIEAARLVWDMDVLAPGQSGNLAITIPGLDRSKTLILSAHIDSPNGPGAMDDGSGSVALLEVARVLNQAKVQPAVDLMLVWYGSEELGAYGSAYFVGTHQELLDRTLAMLQVDCLTRPLDGVRNTHLELVTWSYGHFGDKSLPWPDALASAAAENGVEIKTENRYAVESDNTPFGGFDVPNANLIYISSQMGGGIHYKAHIHSPYDTVELAMEVAPVLEDMARVALTAALTAPEQLAGLRVTPPTQRRALFLANHAEAMTMSPVSLIEFGMALAMEGYDVDMIPYGQELSSEDLVDADLVVALPVYDYGTVGADSGLDEGWSQAEIDLLEAYVRQGGFLVLTNSTARLKFHNWVYDQNENWRKMNALAGRFGINYRFTTLATKNFWVEKIEHPLLEGITYMELIPENAIPLGIRDGLVLAYGDNKPVMVLASPGKGQVLALGDLGILGNIGQGTPENLQFWLNLARYITR